MLASTAPKEAFLDYGLKVYLSEIYVFLRRVVDAKAQLNLLWNDAEYCASNIARGIRKEHNLCDHVLRESLKVTAINSLYSVLADNQSKCFSRLLKLHKNGPLSRVLTDVYQPLWDAYQNYYKQEILRLAVNRNNYYAHVSREKATNEILSWDTVSGKHTIIDYTNVIGVNCESIFSDQSLDFLQGLYGLLSYAQIKEVYGSMVNDIDGHLAQFKKIHPLNIGN